MNKYVSRGLLTVLFTGGLMAVGVGAANAADNTTGDDGTGSGTQATLGIHLPITIDGNGISLLGDSSSTGASTTPPAAPAPSSGSTSGSVSLLGGTQALLDVDAPITVSGNALSVLGSGDSAASTTAPTPAPGFTGDTGDGTTADGASTTGTGSILSGSQILGAVRAPVTVSGNAISVTGDSSSDGSTVGRGFAGASSTGAPTTSGDSGVGSGTQVVPDVAAPVTVGGNAISLLGDASSTGSSSSSGDTGSGTAGTAAPTTSGSGSVLGGSQIAPDVTAPVTASGDAVSVLGDATTSGSSTTAGGGSGSGSTSGSTGSSTGGATTSGANGIGGGSQVIPDVTAPVTASGDAVSVLGDATSTGSTSDGSTGGSVGGVDTTSDGASTTGDSGILSGSQLAPVIRIPVTVGGNAVSVTGDSTTTGGTTDPGQPGEVGGVDTFPPTDATPGTISAAAVSEQALASTGVSVLPGLLAALALLLAGIAMRVRVVLARR